MEKQINCEIVKVVRVLSGKRAQWQVRVSSKDCPWSHSIKLSDESRLCCSYKKDLAVYACPGLGEAQVMKGEKGYQYNTHEGPSTVFCKK